MVFKFFLELIKHFIISKMGKILGVEGPNPDKYNAIRLTLVP